MAGTNPAPSPAPAAASGSQAAATPTTAAGSPSAAPGTASPAQGQDVAAGDEAPKLSWRERIFKKTGRKSAGDFHPGAEQIRSQRAPRAAAESAAAATPAMPAAVAAPAGPDLASENAALRAQLAAFQAQNAASQVLAQREPAASPEAPARLDPSAQPFQVAASQYLGDGASPELVGRAAAALHQLTAYRHQADYEPDPKLKARAAAEVQRFTEQLEGLRHRADSDRELAALRSRLDRYEAPRVDAAAQTAKLFADGSPLGKHFPRLAHALASGAVNKATIEARLGKLDTAQELAAWQEAAVGVLGDLDELFPDPPAATPQPAAAAAIPGNPAAHAPRQSSGTSAPIDPSKLTDGDRRSRLFDRWHSRGPIESVTSRRGRGGFADTN